MLNLLDDLWYCFITMRNRGPSRGFGSSLSSWEISNTVSWEICNTVSWEFSYSLRFRMRLEQLETRLWLIDCFQEFHNTENKSPRWYYYHPCQDYNWSFLKKILLRYQLKIWQHKLPIVNQPLVKREITACIRGHRLTYNNIQML